MDTHDISDLFVPPYIAGSGSIFAPKPMQFKDDIFQHSLKLSWNKIPADVLTRVHNSITVQYKEDNAKN
jgi:hypothetical protein